LKKKTDVASTTQKKKKTSPKVEQSAVFFKLHEINIDAQSTDDIAGADILIFSRPGPQKKLLRKLRRGLVPIDASLDLHGMRVTDAYAETMNLINHSLASGYRCVKIIHGKGRSTQAERPILKNKVNNWLKQIPQVMAFCSALPNDGGVGAVYVLLKKINTTYLTRE